MLIGYARASSELQSLEIQIEQLHDAGVEERFLFKEKVSGTKMENRVELHHAIRMLGVGDTLLVTKLDRLARSTKDALKIMDMINERGAMFKALNEPFDTTTPGGELFFTLLAAMATFETAIRKERQLEGVAKAKANGRYTGRRPKCDYARMRKLKSLGWGASAIARDQKVSIPTVYKVCGRFGGPIPIGFRAKVEPRVMIENDITPVVTDGS
jgi:DNA invertase Pin-like site-specific DNA recombinase